MFFHIKVVFKKKIQLFYKVKKIELIDKKTFQ